MIQPYYINVIELHFMTVIAGIATLDNKEIIHYPI